MPRNYNETEIVRAICYQIMHAWQFDYNRKREWVIYGARHQACRTCSSPPYSPCLNMVDVKRGRTPRINRQPHEDRIDWGRILEGLKFRDYYKASIERQIRTEVAKRG